MLSITLIATSSDFDGWYKDEKRSKHIVLQTKLNFYKKKKISTLG